MLGNETYHNRDRIILFRVVIAFAFFLATAFALNGKGQDDYIVMIFGSTTFVFGILLAFYISTYSSRFENVTSELQIQNGAVLYIYYTSTVFSKKISDEILHLLDAYLIAQLDYFLVDFSKSNKAFRDLFQYLVKLPTTTDKEKEAYGNMIDKLDEALKSRKNIESKVRSQMSRFEWFSLIILLAVVLMCLFFLNTNTYFASIVIALLATSSVLLLLILRDLETFRWKEQTGIWDPIGREFEELGLLPYYPKGVIEKKRIVPRKGSIRIATYPHPYPDMRDKTVVVVEPRQ